MSIEPPLHKQMKDETCALACLRMILSAFGTDVTENAIEAQARMEISGTPIEELERLARHFNVRAKIQEASAEQLRIILAEGKFPIVYHDRALFGLSAGQRAKYVPREPKIHTVIPIHVGSIYVTYHDPLTPRITRRTIEVFEQAHRILGGLCVVCSKPA